MMVGQWIEILATKVWWIASTHRLRQVTRREKMGVKALGKGQKRFESILWKE
jgi:hypothetical protein